MTNEPCDCGGEFFDTGCALWRDLNGERTVYCTSMCERCKRIMKHETKRLQLKGRK